MHYVYYCQGCITRIINNIDWHIKNKEPSYGWVLCYLGYSILYVSYLRDMTHRKCCNKNNQAVYESS